MAVVSADGATASQAIIHFVNLYFTGERDNLKTAYVYLRNMTMGLAVPAGIIPLSTPNIMFKSEDGTETATLPGDFALLQNFPNPFNPATEISFVLAHASDVRLEIYNVVGQKVATLVTGSLEAGQHTVSWNASAVASGVYLYRLQAGDFSETKKMLLLK